MYDKINKRKENKNKMWSLLRRTGYIRVGLQKNKVRND